MSLLVIHQIDLLVDWVQGAANVSTISYDEHILEFSRQFSHFAKSFTNLCLACFCCFDSIMESDTWLRDSMSAVIWHHAGL